MAKGRRRHIDKRMEELYQRRMKRNKRMLFIIIELCMIGGLVYGTYIMYIDNDFYNGLKSQNEIELETSIDTIEILN